MSAGSAGAAAARRQDGFDEVVRGLTAERKTLPSKYFYDDVGAALFVRITTLDAYYPTRAELEILERSVDEIADRLGPGCRVLEFGSGSGLKTRILLEHLRDPVAYVPVDISAGQLADLADDLAGQFPGLEVLPVAADYTRPFILPAPRRAPRRTVAFFPGSTIGNFEPDTASAFLRGVAACCGPDGALVIGVDLRKDRATLELAYNDPEGVTAAFNRNILVHVNRLFDADFDPSAFAHRAIYDEAAGRIEMHLVSRRDQRVRIGRAPGRSAIVTIRAGEPIVTEHSYKYEIDGFQRLAAGAGWRPDRVWTDARGRFSVHLLTTDGGG